MSGDKIILLVDDDADIREMLALVLEDEGYQVVSAGNGAEALTYLRSQPAPRAILLDLMMPVMDGWAFRAEQQRDPALAHIPVIVVSAGADCAKDAKAMGAANCLRKPLDIESLVETIEAVSASEP